MDFIGEHTWAGDLGRFLVILSFTSALLSAFAYIKYWDKSENAHWQKLGRTSFWVHAISIFSVVGLLFFIMLNNYFEFHYVWSHTSLDMPNKYMFASFWEGQEGSFLLWMFWHAVLGIILMYTAKAYESGSMISMVLVQAFLATMISGVYIFDVQFGQSPFVLIREMSNYIGASWTMDANYLAMEEFHDGQGLNPLLRNYWMTIHPPTLFLGFASTLIPFGFAIAGLLKNDHKGWIKHALPWAFFSVGILGIGILMGGAWAYESLSFGGFWAWDPVENASLVPWLVMVGAAHVLLIQRNRGGSIHSAYILTLLAFILILYSTFLTRSGILGETSVHSFVDLGLMKQLVIYLIFFIVAGFGLYFYRFKAIKSISVEDSISSREFWMFIGSMILLLSALQITLSTSTPVWNALFGLELAPPDDPIAHYNQWQTPFAVVIAFLIAMGQLLNYKNTGRGIFWKRALFSIGLAIACTGISIFTLGFENPVYILMLLMSFWALFANLDFWLRIGKRASSITGSSVAHVGVALILLGTLISQSKQEIITSNDKQISEQIPASENLFMEKFDTLTMGEYRVQWFDEYREDPHIYYPIRVWEPGAEEVSFVLEPFIQMNEKMGQVREPSTKHYWDKDVYSHLSYADTRDSAERYNPWAKEQEFEISLGERIPMYNEYIVQFDSVIIFNLDTTGGSIQAAKIGAHLTVQSLNNEKEFVIPRYAISAQGEIREDAVAESLGLKFRFGSADAQSQKVTLKSWKLLSEDEMNEVIILRAIIFPYINLLWLGCITMGIGTFIAVYQRIRKRKTTA